MDKVIQGGRVRVRYGDSTRGGARDEDILTGMQNWRTRARPLVTVVTLLLILDILYSWRRAPGSDIRRRRTSSCVKAQFPFLFLAISGNELFSRDGSWSFSGRRGQGGGEVREAPRLGMDKGSLVRFWLRDSFPDWWKHLDVSKSPAHSIFWRRRGRGGHRVFRRSTRVRAGECSSQWHRGWWDLVELVRGD